MRIHFGGWIVFTGSPYLSVTLFMKKSVIASLVGITLIGVTTVRAMQIKGKHYFYNKKNSNFDCMFYYSDYYGRNYIAGVIVVGIC